jgi:hypothetical protein
MLDISFPVIWLHHSLARHPATSQPRLASQYRDHLLPEELLSGLKRLELADESGLDADVPVLWGVSKLARSRLEQPRKHDLPSDSSQA